MLPPEWAYMGEGTTHAVAKCVWVFTNALIVIWDIWWITGKATRVVVGAYRLRIGGVAAILFVRGTFDLNVCQK
jgi:hypothetical protein